MALRKDKIQALKDSLCLDNVDPSTRSALNNLVDNLIPLFEATALPELPELEGLNTGQDEPPVEEEEELEEPVGEGEPLFFDPLDGFEDPPPGGGDDQGGGGDEICLPSDLPEIEERHRTFLAKTTEEIPAAENGNPGRGLVQPQKLVQTDKEQYDKCVKDITKQYKEDIREAEVNLMFARDRGEVTIPFKDDDASAEHWNRRIRELEEEKQQAIVECKFKLSEDGPEDDGLPLIAQNISCEKIEKDKTVVVSGVVETEIYRLSDGSICDEKFIKGNLFITVESCGCD